MSEIIAGCDEVGRGPLAGPVVASAVILPKNFDLPNLKDSKKLSAKQREALVPLIEETAIATAIGSASPAEIDQYNILQATFLAMHRAIDQLVKKRCPTELLIDGNRFKAYPEIPHRCIIRGDATIPAIAAASILAKVDRDRTMALLAQQYPGYGWERNAGYPTVQHRKAIAAIGMTPLHRRSFCRK